MDSKIQDLKNQIQKLYDKKGRLNNDLEKLEIDYQVSKLRKEIERLQSKPKKPVQKVQQQKVEFKKEEKKEEKVVEDVEDLNRVKVSEPGSTIPDNHKKEDKKEYNNNNKNDNKKN